VLVGNAKKGAPSPEKNNAHTKGKCTGKKESLFHQKRLGKPATKQDGTTRPRKKLRSLNKG